MQQPHRTLDVIGELVAEHCMSETDAYAHVRQLLREAIECLHSSRRTAQTR